MYNKKTKKLQEKNVPDQGLLAECGRRLLKRQSVKRCWRGWSVQQTDGRRPRVDGGGTKIVKNFLIFSRIKSYLQEIKVCNVIH